jgi:phosphatidate cytidylyltransferase
MLRERVLVALVLIPIGGWIIFKGGWIFGIAFTLVLVLAVGEYASMYHRSNFRPALPLQALAVGAIGILRYVSGPSDFAYAPLLIALICLGAMTWHAVDYEKGAPRSGIDFAITISGVMYIGWAGAYMISLRNLPNGFWWFLIIFPSLWIADSAAYFFGKAFGKHRMAPRVSPKKTWEGYTAGIIFGAFAGAFMTGIADRYAAPTFEATLLAGFILGALIATLAPIGDLGISMMKRELEIKDTGKLLPGHGGVLDRIDSWIWAGVLGYYLIPLIISIG